MLGFPKRSSLVRNIRNNSQSMSQQDGIHMSINSRKSSIENGEYGPSLFALDHSSIAATEVNEFDSSMPKHLVREFKQTYGQHVNMEKYLILKMKEMEKENRQLKGRLFTVGKELKVLRESQVANFRSKHAVGSQLINEALASKETLADPQQQPDTSNISLSGTKMLVQVTQTQPQYPLQQLRSAVLLRDEIIQKLYHELNQQNEALRQQSTLHQELVNGQK